MGKVFRLHTGANTLEGWDDANAPYGTSAINPFAQMETV